jgi:acylphosphatase
MSKITKHLRVFGRVQGIGYRAWTIQTATAFHLTGWVRNRKDGSVEIVATGHTEEIRRFVDACRKGPKSARVETIRELEGIDENLKDFTQRETA